MSATAPAKRGPTPLQFRPRQLWIPSRGKYTARRTVTKLEEADGATLVFWTSGSSPLPTAVRRESFRRWVTKTQAHCEEMAAASKVTE